MRAPRIRWRRAAMRSHLFWLVAATAAVTTGAVGAAAVNDAERRAAAWGPSRPVVVARHDLAPGAILQPEDVAVEARPVGAVAEGTVDETAELDGRVVTDRLLAGEPVVMSRLAPAGVRGAAALVPAGHAAVLVPASAHPPRLLTGNHVDVIGGLGAGLASPSASAEVIARSAPVIDVADDGSVLVAVPRDQAPAAAAAILDGSIVVALVGS